MNGSASSANSTRWLLTGTGIFLLVIAFVFWPLPRLWQELFLGTSLADVYCDMAFQRMVADDALLGNFTYTTAINFPDGLEHYGRFNWLYLLMSAPLCWLGNWPGWWNSGIILALLSGALSLAYCVQRFSNSKSSALLAGIAYLSLLWLQNEIVPGHLSQLWTAPFFLAVAALREVFTPQANYKSWLILSFWTIITGLFYWINLLFFLIIALGLSLSNWRSFAQKSLWRGLFISMVCTSAVLAPVVYKIAHSGPDMAGAINNSHTQSFQLEQQLRAMKCSLHFFSSQTPSRRPEVMAWPPGATWAIWLAGLSIAALLGQGIYKGQHHLLWLLLTGLFACFCLGPYLIIDGQIAANNHGQPLLTPFILLGKICPVLTRWSVPSRAVPAVFLCFCLWWASLIKALKGQRQPTPSAANFAVSPLIMAVIILGFLCQLVLALHLGDRRQVNRDQTAWGPEAKLTALQSLESNSPSQDHFADLTSWAYTPAYTTPLSQLPRGAVLDLPIGFCDNTWPLYSCHRQPLANKVYYMAPDYRPSPFIQYLYSWNFLACHGLKAEHLNANQAYLYAYKGREVPLYGLRTPDTAYTHSLVGSINYNQAQVAADCQALYNTGVRYLVIHRANCNWLDEKNGGLIFHRMSKLARKVCGPPLFSDYQAEVFALPHSSATLEALKASPQQ